MDGHVQARVNAQTREDRQQVCDHHSMKIAITDCDRQLSKIVGQ